MKKLFLIGNIFLPQIVAAAGYTLLEPSLVGLQKGASVGLIQYLQLAFNTLITVSIILAIAYLVYGGALYILSGIPGQVSKGKGVIENALIGLVLVLASWLILHTVNPNLTTLNLDLSTSGTSGITSNPAGSTPTTSGTTPNEGGTPNTGNNTNPDGSTGKSSINEQTARDEFQKAGIKVTSTKGDIICGPGQTSGCTSVAGIQQSTINDTTAIKAACPSCDVIVTAGTEHGASSSDYWNHWNGYAVDLQSNTSMDQYFQNNISNHTYTYAGKTSYGNGDLLDTYTDTGSKDNYHIKIYDERTHGGGGHWHFSNKP